MNTAVFLMMQHNQMMMQQSARRRQEEEERNRRRRQEERKREEERKKTIEHRKNSPVKCNGEQWQIDRCVKVISMQPYVKQLISVIEELRPTIIKEEEKRYDDKILSVGYEYELIKKELDNDIETLNNSGISIEGTAYELSRLTPTDTNIAKIEQISESYGNIFTKNDEQPIKLNPSILSNEDYYVNRYNELNPDNLEQRFLETNIRMNRYQKYGKYLRFLLKTKSYLELEEKSKKLTVKHDECILRKKEMQSFNSFSKDQLLTIKSYFVHLDQLSNISKNIEDLFHTKKMLKNDNNETIYDLTIKELLSSREYDELVSKTYNFIHKIYLNDPETMKYAYELVKGEYPINISRRFIYDLLISNIKNYSKENNNEKKLILK